MPHEMIVIDNTDGGMQENDLGAGIREKRFFHKIDGEFTKDTGLVIYYNDKEEIIGHRKPMGEEFEIDLDNSEIKKARAKPLWTAITIPYLQKDKLSIDPLEDHILLDESGTVRTQYGLTTDPDQRFPTDALRSQLAGNINNIKIPRIDDKGNLYLSDECDKLYETDDLLPDLTSNKIHQSQLSVYRKSVADHFTEVANVRLEVGKQIKGARLGNYIEIFGGDHYTGKPAVLDAVLSSTYDFNGQQVTPMQFAVLSGNLELVQKLAEIQPLTLRDTDKNGDTLLHLAAEAGHLEVARFLVETNKIDVNIKNHQGNTALHLAVLTSDQMVEAISADRNIDFNVPNQDGQTALHFAVEEEDKRPKETPVITLLRVAKGTIIPDMQNQLGNTALHYAVAYRDKRTAITLLNSGARLDVLNGEKKSPLALASDNPEMLALLNQYKELRATSISFAPRDPQTNFDIKKHLEKPSFQLHPKSISSTETHYQEAGAPPEVGYVKMTKTDKGFEYEVVKGANDPEDKVYTIKVARKEGGIALTDENGKPKEGCYDTICLDKHGKLLGYKQATQNRGDSQISQEWHTKLEKAEVKEVKEVELTSNQIRNALALSKEEKTHLVGGVTESKSYGATAHDLPVAPSISQSDYDEIDSIIDSREGYRELQDDEHSSVDSAKVSRQIAKQKVKSARVSVATAEENGHACFDTSNERSPSSNTGLRRVEKTNSKSL